MRTAPLVAVTGATGFLGIHLVAALARQGARIRILVRRDPIHEMWRGLALDVVPGSLENASALERLVTGADAVVHAAGLIAALDPDEFMRINRDGMRSVAQVTRLRAPSARFVGISSLAARLPSISAYAASKRAGEEVARASYADAPDKLVIVRPPAIYGPWDRETLAIFNTASRPVVPVFGSGRSAIVHVTDASAAIAKLALGAGEAGCYALADPNPAGYKLPELFAEAVRALGHNPRFIRVPDRIVLAAGRVSSWMGSCRRRSPTFTLGKSREMLHPDWSIAPSELLPPSIYQAKIGISEGFRDTVAWYRAEKWLT